MKKNKLDVSKYNIKFPEKGLLIGLEWLIVEENKYNFEYSTKKGEKSFVTYAPSLVINYSEIENAYGFRGGRWIKNKNIHGKFSKISWYQFSHVIIIKSCLIIQISKSSHS